MKKILSLFVLFIILNCNSQNTTDSHLDTKKIITNILNNWHKAAANANFDNYFEAMDTNSIFVGTDAKEVWSKKEFKNFSKPFFDKGKAWSFTTLKRNIYIHSSKEIVWFDEILDTWMGICRGSGVLEKVNNQWKIKHYVLSVTIPNENIESVIKIKQEKDALLIKDLKN